MDNFYRTVMIFNISTINRSNFKIAGQNSISYTFRGKSKMFILKSIRVCICDKCGDFTYSEKSMEEKIYCKCDNGYGTVYDNKCKYIHREKLNKVLDQLIYTMYSESDSDTESYDYNSYNFCQLKPSTYSHSGECTPDARTCDYCWRYWCMSCRGGVGGMYGSCTYKRCRSGRKNCNLEH